MSNSNWDWSFRSISGYRSNTKVTKFMGKKHTQRTTKRHNSWCYGNEKPTENRFRTMNNEPETKNRDSALPLKLAVFVSVCRSLQTTKPFFSAFISKFLPQGFTYFHNYPQFLENNNNHQNLRKDNYALSRI